MENFVISETAGWADYWRRLAALAAGWIGKNEVPCGREAWGVLGDSLVEIPVCPMHARRNSGFSAWTNEVLENFEHRIRIVVEQAPGSVFFALGSHVRSALIRQGIVKKRPVRRWTPACHGRDPALLGARFHAPVTEYEMSLGGDVRLFARSVFSHGHQPKELGILELGRWLRAAQPRDRLSAAHLRQGA